MANVELSIDSEIFPDEDGRGYSRFVNWLGAVLSVTLVGALGIWVYQLTTRDVSNVPIVRATQSPMRIAPEDPGGDLAEHQGLAVNQVTADGGVQAPADRLVLAPPPESLTEDDVPGSQLDQAGMEGQPQVADASHQPSMSDDANAELVSVGIPALESEQSPGDQAQDPMQVEEDGIQRSPLPVPRPEVDPIAQSVARAVARSVQVKAIEVEPSSIPAGTPLAQFGAYDSPETARNEWARLKGQFPQFLRGRNWIVEETVSGGRSFYRLRTTGFDSLNDSKRFCSLFTAEGQDCVAVQTRR